MATTVSANKMTVVHAGSDGVCQAFPDVCKTPAAPSPVPIPYPNIAMSRDAADTASSVKADGHSIMVSTSKYATSTGDEAGSLGGVVSGKVKGSANPQSWSMDVKAEGKNVFRLLDLMLHNGGSKPTNTPPGPNGQPPSGAIGKKTDPKKKKITEIRWSETKLKCGDPVKIGTTTENYEDGFPLPHRINRDQSKGKRKKRAMLDLLDVLPGKVKGNEVELDWITKAGSWRKTPIKLEVKAQGPGGTKKSANQLEIEIPAEKTLPPVKVSINVNNGRVVRGFKVPFTSWALGLPIGGRVGSDMGYDLAVKGGFIELHCKVRLVNLGVSPAKLPGLQRNWKAEIEHVWDKKWKEHREACKRRDGCNCSGGCCLFPIRVKCSFVSAGEHVVVKLHPGPANYNKWWNSANWHESLSVGGLEGNGAVVHAHEFGHSIGMYDEYAGGSVRARFFDVDGSIMQHGTEVMIQHWTKHPVVGESIHKKILDMLGESYKLLKM